MTRSKTRPVDTYVLPSYEQYLGSFEKALATLVSEVSAMKSESEFMSQHRTKFGYLFNTANSRLGWTKAKIVEAFAPLNTGLVVVQDCCPVAFRREGEWARRFGASEVITDIRLMTRSEAAEWIVDYGHKVGYTPGQIERSRAELKSLRRRAA